MVQRISRQLHISAPNTKTSSTACQDNRSQPDHCSKHLQRRSRQQLYKYAPSLFK
ncbi:MAG: hypothetical protein V7L06_18395 [Nostoc sp.]